AVPLLARTRQLIAEVEMKYRAMLYADALVVAGHFGRVELVPELLELLGAAIHEATEADVEQVLEQSLRALRRVCLRTERASLLAEVVRAVPAARLRSRLALAAGIASLGDFSRALPIFEQAHETLAGSMTMGNRLELTRALAIAYSQTPLSIALHG